MLWTIAAVLIILWLFGLIMYPLRYEVLHQENVLDLKRLIRYFSEVSIVALNT